MGITIPHSHAQRGNGIVTRIAKIQFSLRLAVARMKNQIQGSAGRNTIPIIVLIACPLLLGGCGLQLGPNFFTPPKTPVNIIYDDDCDGDIDCTVTQPIIHHWIDIGYVKIWGMVSSAPSMLGAPAMKVFQNYYGHDGLFPIGAWTPGCALLQSAPWYVALVGKFDPGDVCTNYKNCGTVLRQSVANYIAGGGKANGLTYVITGPLMCEEEFRATPADGISSLTGVQMEQRFIKEFVLLNGYAPSGQEPNCTENASACSAFFTNVTSGSGYPPVYVVPVNTGATSVVTTVPTRTLPLTNPTAYAFNFAGVTQTGDEDALAVEYAVYGNSGWILSANGTDTVSAATGENSWSHGATSGQYYLSTAIPPSFFEKLLSNPWLPSSESASVLPSPGERRLVTEHKISSNLSTYCEASISPGFAIHNPYPKVWSVAACANL
jgi:hypothetical protein